jgi:hypothetical protein
MYLLLLLLLLLLIPGCSMKSARKNMIILKLGDTKETALEFRGDPDVIKRASGPWGEGEYWMYECVKFPDCDDSNCFFCGPYYYLYFMNDRLVSIYDTTDL